jgi:rod shape-determining protein MreC
MIRLSISTRHALARLTLPVLVVAAFALLLLGKADALLAERARMALADALAPIYAVLSAPLGRAHAVVSEFAELTTVRSENVRLRDENERLRRWQSVALALDSENQRLRANLHWIPDPAPAFVTARVVADAGGVYARAVLLALGPNHGISKGQIALDERGLVGRVTEVGARTARVLLLTDLNSRIPVILETSRTRAILVGTNGARPRLTYWSEGVVPAEGERVVTSAEAGAFPANLPVGTVHYSASNVPEVEASAMLDRLEVVRIFDYGLRGIVAPEARGGIVAPEARGSIVAPEAGSKVETGGKVSDKSPDKPVEAKR